jgi:drug/metabolite transporter (DMT)-like permease
METSVAGLAAVLGCSVAFALLDLSRKALAARIRPVPLLVLLAVGQLPLFAGWLAASEAAGAGRGYLAPGLGSVLLNIAANLAFLEAVRLSPLSLTIPFLSLTPVFASLLAVPLLGEVPSGLQVAGILTVVAGAVTLNLERGKRASLPGMWRAFRRERGSVLMVGVAFLWALAMPLDKLAMEAASAPFHGLVLNAGVGVGCLLVLAGQRRWRELATTGRALWLVVGAVLASAVALALQLIALTLVWVGLVETLKRATGCLLAVVLGRAAFGEPVTAAKLAAITLMVLGVAAVMW